jgi:phosphatidylglycerophosphatase A
MNASIGRWIRRALGSCGFLGYIPPAPGTLGSLLVVVLLWLFRGRLAPYFAPGYNVHYWIAALALIAASILVANNAREDFNAADPKQFILDECAGQFVTFFMVPFSWKALVLGFLLFRFFDIVKPFPVYNMEEIEGGVGITMDDVAAGVMANISLMGMIFVYHAIKNYL